MRKLSAFVFISLDGYYKGPKGDISWHQHAGEADAFASKMLKQGNTLVFGRATYEMMAAYWPSAMAQANDAKVAAGMNAASKIVFSRSLKKVAWSGTTLLKGDLLGLVKALKAGKGKDMTILGSGDIVRQLAQAGLIDEYQILVNPVVLGKGTPLFDGLKAPLALKLKASQAFKNGSLLLTYVPAGRAQ